MAEYINLDNALERLLFSMCGTGYQYDAMHTISSMPTIDIVFCKDCKHLEISGCYGECGKGYLGIVRPDCYCCYGERRFDNG